MTARDPSAPAIVLDRRRHASFGELHALAESVRAAIGEWSLGPGDVVAWPAIGRAETAAALATMPACATLMPLAANLTVDAYERAFRRTGTRALVLPRRRAHPAREAALRANIGVIGSVPREGETGLFDLEPETRATPGDHPGKLSPDVAFVVLTSGTTGHPKLVPCTWSEMSVTFRAMGRRLAIGPGDASGHLTTMHLANGLRNAGLLAIVHGGAIRVLPEGDVDALLAAVSNGEVTFASASFAICRELLQRLEDGAPFTRGRLRFLRVASGRMEAGEMDRLEAHLGAPVVTGLSTTETGTLAQQDLARGRRARGSVGVPLAAEVRIVGECGEVVPRGEVGEVQVRGPQVFRGYLDDRELNLETFAGGWFRPGDLGRIDERGELRLAGRRSETINRGGEKIAPAEVDAALRAQPGVADAAAFGVPHPSLGEEVVAAVVALPGATLDVPAVIGGVRRMLGDRRAPRTIWAVERLPRTPTGKVERTKLPAMVGFAPAERRAEASSALAAPPLEIALAALWRNALQRASVAHDDAFSALGGDAASGAVLIGQVKAAFGVELPARSLNEDAATIAGMARLIERMRESR